MVTDYAIILSRLEMVKAGSRAGLWHARCPCGQNHKNGDRNPSARLWVDGAGRLNWWCAKGCKWKEVVEATGTRATDWFPPGSRPAGRTPMAGRVVKVFGYADEAGTVLYEVCRTEPKSFFQRRPVPGHPGEYAHTLSDGLFVRERGGFWREVVSAPPEAKTVRLEPLRKVPYRLPDLVDPRKADQPVLVVEGEGKADLLADLRFVATCAQGGAGRWPWEFGKHLAGRRVVVFPDADEVGRQHAWQVAASCLMHKASSVRVVTHGMGWEALPDRADVKDWLALVSEGCPPEDLPGRRREAVIDLVKLQPQWREVHG